MSHFASVRIFILKEYSPTVLSGLPKGSQKKVGNFERKSRTIQKCVKSRLKHKAVTSLLHIFQESSYTQTLTDNVI